MTLRPPIPPTIQARRRYRYRDSGDSRYFLAISWIEKSFGLDSGIKRAVTSSRQAFRVRLGPCALSPTTTSPRRRCRCSSTPYTIIKYDFTRHIAVPRDLHHLATCALTLIKIVCPRWTAISHPASWPAQAYQQRIQRSNPQPITQRLQKWDLSSQYLLSILENTE